MDIQQSYIFPINSLPVETLQRVFFYALPLRSFQSDSAVCPSPHGWLDPSTVPFLLQLVCSRWRDAAEACPDLWRNLSLPVTRPDVIINLDRHIQFMRRWLTLRGILSFALRLDYTEVCKNNIDQDEDGVDAILLHCPRVLEECGTALVHLELNFPTRAIRAAERMTIPAHALSDIKVLHVSFGDDNLRYGWADRIAAFSAAPLEELTICCADDAYLPPLTLRWSTLTSLTFGWTSAEECLFILRECPRLKTAVLSSYFTSNGVIAPPSVLSPELEVLEVFIEDFNIDILLNALSAPSLTRLAFGVGNDPDRFPSQAFTGEALIGFITRSKCTLEGLSFAGVPLGYENLIRCLELTPSLRSLDVMIHKPRPPIRPVITDRVLRYLTHNDDGVVLPRLQFVSLSLLPPFTDELVLNMVQSRCRAQSVEGRVPLQKVILSLPFSQLDPSISLSLQALASGTGLNCTVDEQDGS